MNDTIHNKLTRILDHEGPALLNVDIDPRCRVITQVKFGRPNEDADPLLDRAEFHANMIVKPLSVSL